MRQTGMGIRPHAIVSPGAEPLRPGTVQENISTPQDAYRIYEESLARAPEREVGIYRNLETSQYAVRVGSELQISPPITGRWETVLHYHPNRANVLTYRMPAPADIQGTAIDAFRSRRTITEFVEYPVPGAGRGRVAYTVTPQERITIEYERTDGSRVQRNFANLNDYQRTWSERTTYLEPGSPEYRWVMQDLNEFYQGESGFGGSTMAGAARMTGSQAERAAMQESQSWWNAPGVTTETRFARHQQTFDSIAATLRNARESLARTGRHELLPAVNDRVLRTPVDEFIRRNPQLNREWQQMERDSRSNPELRRDMSQFLEGRLEGGGSREIGSRRPDIVEFFLERGEVIVTDVATATTRVHAFKTDFYRAVIETMIGSRTGPRIYGVDINVAVQPIPTSIVTPSE
jgi:hypothetical protein